MSLDGGGDKRENLGNLMDAPCVFRHLFVVNYSLISSFSLNFLVADNYCSVFKLPNVVYSRDRKLCYIWEELIWLHREECGQQVRRDDSSRLDEALSS